MKPEKILNREQISQILPHKGPMLLVDEAWLGGGAYKVKGDEFFLQGHFPGNPIVPGVILCEIMAQSACVELAEKLKGTVPYLTGIDRMRIRNKVKPGDVFRTEVFVSNSKGPLYVLEAKGFVGDLLCVSGTLSFASI